MIIEKLAIALCVALLTVCPLPKQQYSSKKNLIMTGAAATRSEPAPGFCNGANLQVPIIDTSYYTDISKEQLPSKFILDMPTPGDQGNQGSCAAWATVYGVGSFYVHFTTGKPYSDTGNLSPRFIYNQISKGDCSCTSVLDNLYLLKTQGACTVNAMPYDANDCSTQPDSMQRSLAENYKIKGWQKIELHNLSLLKRAITESKPIIFSISTDQGFRKISKPFMWDTREGAIEPAHSMILAGYDDEKKAFRVMNSWGTAWGDKGFAWIGYDFFLTNVLRGGHIVL